MATANPTNPPQENVGALGSTARVLVVGLGWAALMLVVLGSWMRIKRGETNNYYAYIFYGTAAAAALMCVWQAFTLWFQKVGDAERAASLAQQRKLFGMVFLAAGLGFIGLAIALGLGKKTGGGFEFVRDNLGESIGVLFFGLIALGAGWALSQANESRSAVHTLTLQLPMLKFALLVMAVGAASLFVYLAYTNRREQAYMDFLPELFALVFCSILFVACFLWLNTGALDEFGVRLFVLVFGGALGIIIFCYSLGRIVFWRQDIVLGGLEAWQGANAYRFWTCFYLQFAALVLMFGSFNLARTDIRENVYLRRVMYGYDAIVQSLLLFEILVVANIVLYALVPYTFDWTKSRGAYALSDATKNLIGGLKKEAHMVVIMSQNDPVYRDLRNLLDNCQALSNKLKIDYVSPDDAEGYRILALRFKKIQPETPFASVKGVLLVNGPMPDKNDHTVPYAFVTEQKLASQEGGFGKTAKRIFKGEEEVIKEFKFLLQEKKRKVYVLQGDEEPDINGQQPFIRDLYSDSYQKAGLGIFVDKLKRDNYDVFGLSFGKEIPEVKPLENKIIYAKEDADKKKDIPSDCETLIVTPTPKPLPAEILSAIERYMERRDSSMLVFLDVMTDPKSTRLQESGLEPFLKKHGVEVLEGFPLAVRFNVPRPNAATLTAVGQGSENVLARQFMRRSFEMPDTARILKTTDTPRYKAEAVLQLEHRDPDRLTLVENDPKLLLTDLNMHLRLLMNQNQLIPRVSRDPVTVGVAVSETDGGRPRMVVIGDVDFVTNAPLFDASRSQMMRQSAGQSISYAFASSALEWMAGREDIGAKAKVSPNVSIDPTVDTLRMVILPGWLMMLTMVGLGVVIWVVRRR